jgi:hypothetical protein
VVQFAVLSNGNKVRKPDIRIYALVQLRVQTCMTSGPTFTENTGKAMPEKLVKHVLGIKPVFVGAAIQKMRS